MKKKTNKLLGRIPARPWNMRKDVFDGQIHIVDPLSDNHDTILTIDPDRIFEDFGNVGDIAAFVHRAVNSHEALLKAVRSLVEKSNAYRRSHIGEPQLEAAIIKAEEAIALAEGK